jgi:hypothetical protein
MSARRLGRDKSRTRRSLWSSVAGALALAGVATLVPIETPAALASTDVTGPFVELSAVSCPSSTYCVAVGDYRPNDKGTNWTPTAQVWTGGSSWNAQTPPAPTGTNASLLSGVSCASPTSCLAVGSSDANGVDALLAESWNGTAWSIDPTPTSSGSAGADLVGVSCTSSTSCVAVGSTWNATGPRLPLADAWNGSSWSVESTPAPTSPSGALFSAVSCPSAAFCAAVGWYYVGTSGLATFADVWNGSSWSLTSTPDPAGTTTPELEGVSCTSATWCVSDGVAPGKSGSAALLEGWNGTAWTIEKSPVLYTNLAAVSCSIATSCVAAGYDGAAEVWNGTTWAVHRFHLPTTVTESFLDGVACLSATACTGVGWYAKGVDKTLAEGWNGVGWRFETTRY